jgi:hypothetical protein
MSGDERDFFFLQGKAPKEIHAILTEALGKYATSYASYKAGCSSSNVLIFTLTLRLVLEDPN